MNLNQAKAFLKPMGITITHNRDGEYRVNYKEGREATAYYTNDFGDAVDTGKAMAERQGNKTMTNLSKYLQSIEVTSYLANGYTITVKDQQSHNGSLEDTIIFEINRDSKEYFAFDMQVVYNTYKSLNISFAADIVPMLMEHIPEQVMPGRTYPNRMTWDNRPGKTWNDLLMQMFEDGAIKSKNYSPIVDLQSIFNDIAKEVNKPFIFGTGGNLNDFKADETLYYLMYEDKYWSDKEWKWTSNKEEATVYNEQEKANVIKNSAIGFANWVFKMPELILKEPVKEDVKEEEKPCYYMITNAMGNLDLYWIVPSLGYKGHWTSDKDKGTRYTEQEKANVEKQGNMPQGSVWTVYYE